MTLLRLYEAARRREELSQGAFLSLYAASVTELLGAYTGKYVLSPDAPGVDALAEGKPDIYDAPWCFPEYDAAILDNILYLFDPEKRECKEMSISEREKAYLAVWRRLNRRTKAKKRGWD